MTKKLGQILTELGYIGADNLEKALEMQKAEGGRRRLGEVLLGLELREEELLHALSEQFGVPLLEEELFPENLPMEKVSYSFLRENLILPLGVKDGLLEVAVGDPTRLDAFESLRSSLGTDIRMFLAREAAIRNHLDVLQGSRDAMMQRLIEGVEEESSVPTEVVEEVSHLRDLAQEKGIIQLVNMIVENAVRDRASDIHVEPEDADVRVRYRIDGVLHDAQVLPVRMQAALSSRIKLISQMNIAERRLPQDGRIRGRFIGRDIDIRVSTIPTVYGESIVMRLLDKEEAFISLEGLGFDEELLDIYNSIIHKPYGMILITGPTGSGKTTTLYASLDKLNSPDKKIITIEEPVEYLLKGINQIQVRPKIGLTFVGGLRHIVRQDPDIVMVGEIRDMETAGISIHAALTGHLLFSTLHTNDASSAVTRLMDMGVESYLVASTLVGVMAQRLVRRICTHCKEEYVPPDEIKHELGDAVGSLWRGGGCEKCLGTGYRGRIGIFELFIVGDELRDLITNKATSKMLKDKAVALGMRELRRDGLLKAMRGITTVDEVLRVTQVGM